MADACWQFWIDRGGTFTDVVAISPDGVLHTVKLLSENPEHYPDAAVAAIRRLTGIDRGRLPRCDIRIGTTIATNALLERRGEPVLLAISRGFADALTIGTQDRPDIFALRIDRPAPLHAAVCEIDARVAADGTVLRALDPDAARAALQVHFDAGLRAIAIVLMHGYAYPAHEAALGDIARAIGFTQVSVSHEVGALIKLVGRGDTTVVDAYLSPVLRRYIVGFETALGGGQSPLFMQSNGGLTAAHSFRGKDAVLSGPAGGIVGMAETARAAGFDHVIGFDMGGTSTDVSLHAGHYARDNETIVAGARLRAPMLRIHTVAAGGGSICRFADGRLQVGPESAGAIPGPACYRRGGPLTITDCNLALGKLDPAHFPRVFGADGDQPLDRDAALARLEQEAAAAGMAPDDAARGFIAIAVASMANAIKAVSVMRGHDVTRFALACFGGAGGQHACLVADALGIERILIHPLAGVLSAYGMGLADRRTLRDRTVGLALEDPAVIDAAEKLADEARAALIAEGVTDPIRVETRAHLRTRASDSTIDVALGEPAAMRAEFVAQHLRRFGYVGDDALLVDMLRAEAIADNACPLVSPPLPETAAGQRNGVYERAALSSGDRIAGPALIADPVSTTVIEPGWNGAVAPDSTILLSRSAARAQPESGAALDPVRLEIFSGLFMAIAEEMGAALRHSASSVNIRERLDFSCAIFDAEGNLIANAPHIPVHLGSMGASIRTVLSQRGGDGRGIRRGDVYALNSPYDGGTHLPDITVIAPVFAEESGAPSFFVAARGHHADVGGTTPGSMPPDSRSIADEGVIFDNVLLVENGKLREAEVRALLSTGPHPARNIDMNIADLSAQIAACARGAAGLLQLCDDYGADTVIAYMDHVQDHAESAVRALIGRLSGGSFAYAMDNGGEVRVAVTNAGDRLVIDFAGTSAQRSDNFNAPSAVVRAAVLYVIRTLLDRPIPLNDGCLRPIEIRIPPHSMLAPVFPAAVVAGNVETSQVVTDCLFGALGAMAGSQGTMNNFTFGDDTHQYYETIAGGTGAGPGFDGTDVVQSHMTNSRLTDPEVLETRFPVLVEEFAIRRGSGGPGAHHGGDGATRRIRFRSGMRAAILSNRRAVAPFGLAGGMDGAPGVNRIERVDGSVERLGATAIADMREGDVFVIETPGGGGYGAR